MNAGGSPVFDYRVSYD
jgi:hypothetical protein